MHATSLKGLQRPGMTLSDVDVWWNSLDCMDFLSGCGPSPCSLSICSRSFLFLDGACSETFNFFSFFGFSAIIPYVPPEVHARLLRLQFLEDTRRTCLAHPCCYLVSILSDSSTLDSLLEARLQLLWAFLGTLAWRVLGGLWYDS